ncbi:MAG: glycosyltransferase [Burkholderiales bacterium]|nr:glycosyltransferase [Burkholderiales bacterium]
MEADLSAPASPPQGEARSPLAGVVAIGRNEGERLRRCLESVRAAALPVVYVDSGSSDGSAALAGSLGATVVALDTRRPFTAARARNEGMRRLQALVPELAFVQFVDGDCELAPGWLASARAFLEAEPQVAAVCGRRRERFPERSVYNLLCDLEWNTPIGEARACGGDAMMRASAFRQVEGFRDDLVAGEEPELCVRLRAQGWKIWRLDAEMTLHDAAMTRFGQWWQRNVRAGFAYAEGVRLHGAPPERHWVREWRSAWFWGLALPLVVALAAAIVGPVALWALAVYPLQVLRLAYRSRGIDRGRWARAFFLVAGKFPEAFGQAKSALMHLRRQPAVLIEYK